MSELKSFYDYVASDLKTTLPNGTYLLKAKEGVMGEWGDGRPRLEVNTEVVEGEKTGMYGPRITWSLGDSDGVTADGREFHVSAQSEMDKLVRDVRSMLDESNPKLTTPTQFDEAMLGEIGAQVVGATFIAIVKEDKNGYPRASRLFSRSNPPKSYRSDAVAMVNLDNI